ncbi:tRNA (adenosine(37)-N6)-dimethylallyltransferase MiaA [Sphingobacterium endophyticum]|uniref:tRNA (adenosine(37)-N6)-dimethylallyltransferase MiaA n=1 Tax=Sphingobacterium endophyticum TaxID=2546448 RepID=UPI0012E164C7|nr:tRNA (adenosine(37)-N6)-dimethylallyltransferase MiaA [Sphingobacterium endophyticum]
MDEVRDIKNLQELVEIIDQAKGHLSPDFLIIILGPTASGKTRLAVNLAKMMDAEIISADSRQVYKKLDIGTGKDLSEYHSIPYHLIDIVEPTGQYDVQQFKEDFDAAYKKINTLGKMAILCGGTGSYIQSILQENRYSKIPRDRELQEKFSKLSTEDLKDEIRKKLIPQDFQIDWKNHKRLVRALEILNYLDKNRIPVPTGPLIKNYLIFGLNPTAVDRRAKIDLRLANRMEEGFIDEVKSLINEGVSHEALQWFGLEYKYASYYLLGKIDEEEFLKKLRTEIHRYAKRQMTYFRKMEKDGIKINWIKWV